VDLGKVFSFRNNSEFCLMFSGELRKVLRKLPKNPMKILKVLDPLSNKI
jgi:hypothetical protein